MLLFVERATRLHRPTSANTFSKKAFKDGVEASDNDYVPGSEPKSQHYVHRAYLEGFVDPSTLSRGEGRLWVYIANKAPFLQRTERVAKRNYYYCFQENEQRQFRVEHGLQYMEDAALPVLQKACGENFRLTDDERMTLAGYVALSHVRVPTVHRTIDHITSLFHAEQMEAFANNDQAIRQFVEEHRRETGEDLDPLKFKEDLTGGSVVVAQKSKGWTLLQMFRMMETIHELIFRMHWTFMIASNEDGGFLTSDNPVSLYDPVGGPRGAIGFASTPAAYFMFPLSRKLCLVGRHWKGSEVIKLTPFEVRRINTGAIARSDQQVYAPFCSNKIQKIVDNAVSHKPAPRRVLIRKGHIVEE